MGEEKRILKPTEKQILENIDLDKFDIYDCALDGIYAVSKETEDKICPWCSQPSTLVEDAKEVQTKLKEK